MSMTVRKLIALLKKMPPNGKVVVSDHDHDDQSGQFSGSPFTVREASDAMKARGYDVVIRLG
jgi:hypothetical protein